MGMVIDVVQIDPLWVVPFPIQVDLSCIRKLVEAAKGVYQMTGGLRSHAIPE